MFAHSIDGNTTAILMHVSEFFIPFGRRALAKCTGDQMGTVGLAPTGRQSDHVPRPLFRRGVGTSMNNDWWLGGDVVQVWNLYKGLGENVCFRQSKCNAKFSETVRWIVQEIDELFRRSIVGNRAKHIKVIFVQGLFREQLIETHKGFFSAHTAVLA